VSEADSPYAERAGLRGNHAPGYAEAMAKANALSDGIDLSPPEQEYMACAWENGIPTRWRPKRPDEG
jgi:hypothetical protein